MQHEESVDALTAGSKDGTAAAVPGRRWLTWTSAFTIVGIALVGAAIRVAALLPVAATGAFPVDYDEGVYSAAASLLAQGQLPYRDFVFVHPPGLPYLLLPLGGLDPQQAFLGARFVMVAVGAACIALVGFIACRRWGLLAGAGGAAVYASFPEAVAAEHGVFLEPVLNLFCLVAVACWVHTDDRTKRVTWDGYALSAGAFAAAAFTVKLWAAFAIVAMLLVPPTRDRAKKYRALLVGLVVTGLVLWLPVLIGAGTAVTDQVLLFQFGRPGDGAATIAERLTSMVGSPLHPLQARHLAATALAGLGVIVIIGWRRHDRLGRIAVLWFGLAATAFLVSATYWDQYNAALAPSMSLLAAAGFSWVSTALRRSGIARAACIGFLVVAALVTAVSVRRSILEVTSRSDELAAVASDVQSLIPDSECAVAFEPQWLLSAGRLPVAGPDKVLSVDPYAAQLALIRSRSQSEPASTSGAFADQPTEDGILESLSTCRYLLLGWRGHWQLSADQQAWVTTHYRELPTTGPVDIWVRRG